MALTFKAYYICDTILIVCNFIWQTGNAADAMDGYYGCLWDGTLLEVGVALHARRGEGGRRSRAVKAAGALELNANNSEDIQREAAATRRARLLRALTNQYVAWVKE